MGCVSSCRPPVQTWLQNPWGLLASPRLGGCMTDRASSACQWSVRSIGMIQHQHLMGRQDFAILYASETGGICREDILLWLLVRLCLAIQRPYCQVAEWVAQLMGLSADYTSHFRQSIVQTWSHRLSVLLACVGRVGWNFSGQSLAMFCTGQLPEAALSVQGYKCELLLIAWTHKWCVACRQGVCQALCSASMALAALLQQLRPLTPELSSTACMDALLTVHAAMSSCSEALAIMRGQPSSHLSLPCLQVSLVCPHLPPGLCLPAPSPCRAPWRMATYIHALPPAKLFQVYLADIPLFLDDLQGL